MMRVLWSGIWNTHSLKAKFSRLSIMDRLARVLELLHEILKILKGDTIQELDVEEWAKQLPMG
jgi:hypothetical protein